MAIVKELKSGKIIMGKLSHNSDLLEEITEICRNSSISLGKVEALGAIKKARLGYYHQQVREYAFFTIDKPMEITCLIGNISLKENKPVVHAHITLSDEKGNAHGGHLAPGTIVFACEVLIQAFDGQEFKRDFDQETGLPLWNLK